MGWADKPFRLVNPGQHRSSVRESFHFALCTSLAVVSSVVPKLPPSTTCTLSLRRGFLVCGNLSSFTDPSHWCRSHSYSFVSVFSFFFCPTQVRGEFFAFWEVWGLLPAFSRSSVGAVPHADVFLMYLWRGRWSPHLTLPPYWSYSFIPCFLSVFMMKVLDNAKCFFVCLVRWSCGFCPPFIYMVYYISRFSDVKPTTYSWEKLVIVHISVYVLLNSVC